MSKEQKGFIVYGDTKALADELNDEQLGQLFRGMLDYFAEGKAPKFSGILKFAFIPIKQQMDRDAEKYVEKCEKMRANAKKRWKSDANAYKRNQLNANDANTNTNTDTNTKTDTDTDTTTNTDTDTNTKARGGGVSADDDAFNLWKKLDASGIDAIYAEYPESGGYLIEEVAADVRQKKKRVRNPVSYVLGYAKKVGWDDSADHFDGGGML